MTTVLKYILDAIEYTDQPLIRKTIEQLKQTDGEAWACGELIKRALDALNGVSLMDDDVECEHNYRSLEIVKQRGQRASFGLSPASDWRRAERYYCSKCLAKREIIREADGHEPMPDWW